jgi:hypothetical protein
MNNLLCGESISYGIVVVPVADLVGEPIHCKDYSQLPLSGQGSPWRICPRIHQLLFNEIVIIERKEKRQYCIRTPSLFFTTTTSDTPMNVYWTSQDSIMPFTTLQKHTIPLSTIPQPYGKAIDIIPQSQEIITLIVPFYDAASRLTFSAGTRFVVSLDQVSQTHYSVWVFDKTDMRMKKMSIPHSIGISTNHDNQQEKRIQQFVTTLKKWAHLDNGFIPYVWGGCSFQYPHQLSELATVKNNKPGQPRVEIVTYKKKNYTTAKDGFDCAGTVLRAAQISGIPYHCKNTHTLAHCLKPITSYKALREGDLIWIPGHVLIVADLEKNTVIEARDFADGYGKVHEISLNNVFKDTSTFKELVTAFHEQNTLIRLNHPLGKTKEYKTFKILSIASAWDIKNNA